MQINFKAVETFVADVKQDPNLALKQKQILGQCNFKDGQPHFEATVEFAKGSTVLTSDQPPFMGGGGTAPDPILYCLYGTASCFAGTMMMIVAQHGLQVNRMAVTAYNQVDLTKPLGLGDHAIVTKVGLRVQYSGTASETEMQAAVDEATETCPGAYCVTHKIPLETSLVRE
jgi:uncharacterized OsmC-like protein